MAAPFLILLIILPSFAQGVADCSKNVALGCFEDADCALRTTDGKCAGGDMATLVMGCCGELVTTTARTVLTTTSRMNHSCVDKINPMTGVSDCAKNAKLCDVAAYYSVMSEQCPRTCGMCSTGGSNGTTCVDQINPLTRRSDCQYMRTFCDHPAYASIMKLQCPATCGRCSSG